MSLREGKRVKCRGNIVIHKWRHNSFLFWLRAQEYVLRLVWGFFVTCFGVSILVEEVHRTVVDGDSSDSDAGPAATSGNQSTTSKEKSYRKVIGRSQSVSSTGSFVATSEWVIYTGRIILQQNLGNCGYQSAEMVIISLSIWTVLCCFIDPVVETKVTSANDYEDVASTCTTSGENLHWQVRLLWFLNFSS